MTQSPKKFGVILIPTWACNNTCNHCFEKLLPQTASAGFWELFFRRMLELAELKRVDCLVVYWQGGEVLTMSPREVERGLRLGEELFRGTGTVLEHHLQSNLIPYSRDWYDIIVHFFNGAISSSLDYPNVHRSTPRLGVGEYNQAWLEKRAEAERDGLVVNLITLPNPQTLEAGAERFYRYFDDEVGIHNVQINFPFPGVAGDRPARLDRDRLAGFMGDLYRTWVASGRSLNLNPFAPLESRLFQGDGTLPCVFSYSCADFLVSVGPDGEVGQCDCWLSTRKRHSFGYLADQSVEQLLAAAPRQPFLDRAARMIRDPECGACELWSICFGGCPLRAFSFSGEFYSRDYYCPVYRSMCAEILAQHGREAAARIRVASRSLLVYHRSWGALPHAVAKGGLHG